jgi:glucose/arabinose dehydrogenase/pyrrolidone-carboxylate peptidase
MNKYIGLIGIFLSINSFLFAEELQSTKDYYISTIAKGLDHPWSMAFLSDKRILVTERIGRLRLIKNGQLIEQAITGLPEIFAKSQAGLFDVIIDPEFEENQKIYLSFASGEQSSNTLKVISARLESMTLIDVKEILVVSPYRNTSHHYGGRMVFLADGTLLVTSGDGFNFREQAQSLTSLMGKVLRINRDGSIPVDNPFVNQKNARPEIYSVGHRNPQAILVNQKGEIWQHEHGPKGGDELNLILSSKNYGWPAISYGIDYSGALITPFKEAKGMLQPITYWTPSIAPSGMTEYQGSIFPEWQGNLFIAALAEKSVRRLVMQDNAVVEQQIILTELNSRIRDVRTSPDGYLYVLTDSTDGAILKLTANTVSTDSIKTNDLTIEEERIEKATKSMPDVVNRFRSGIDLFKQELLQNKNIEELSQSIQIHAKKLWISSVDDYQKNINFDDRALYWGRLQLTKSLSQSSIFSNLDKQQKDALLWKLELLSRGQDDLKFDKKTDFKILITGFDPFFLDRNIDQSNPSGVAALAFDNKVIEIDGRTAEIESVIVPVRFADFDKGMIEELLTPFIKEKQIDMLITISMGRDDFDIERFPGLRRSAKAPDNLNVYTGADKQNPLLPMLNNKLLDGPEFKEFSLPISAMLKASGEFKINDNRKVSTTEKTFLAVDLNELLNSISVAGSGGGYLSNEVSYRSLLIRDQYYPDLPTGHIHTPRFKGFKPEKTKKLSSRLNQ